MKKKISLLLCMLTAVFVLAGCTSANTDVEYDKAEYEEVTSFLLEYCEATDETVLAKWQSMTDEELQMNLVSSGLPFRPDSFLGAMEAWMSGIEECGELKEYGDFTFEASKSELSVMTDAKFKDRDADITVIYKADTRGNLSLDSLTINGHYSMGEVLEKAGLNTLLGMGTVFAVLILISVVISLMKYIPKLQEMFTRKKEVPAAEAEAAAAVSGTVSETEAGGEAEDDTELIAVIAAAIAASEGTAADGFVVRSIRRRKSNKWN